MNVKLLTAEATTYRNALIDIWEYVNRSTTDGEAVRQIAAAAVGMGDELHRRALIDHNLGLDA